MLDLRPRGLFRMTVDANILHFLAYWAEWRGGEATGI
jgi:hypothetical protein